MLSGKSKDRPPPATASYREAAPVPHRPVIPRPPPYPDSAQWQRTRCHRVHIVVHDRTVALPAIPVETDEVKPGDGVDGFPEIAHKFSQLKTSQTHGSYTHKASKKCTGVKPINPLDC